MEDGYENLDPLTFMAKSDRVDEYIYLRTPPARLHAVLTSVVGRPDFDGQPAGNALARSVGLDPPDLKAHWYRGHTTVAEILADATDFVGARVPEYGDSPHARTFAALESLLGDLSVNEAWGPHRQNLFQLVTIALPFSVHAAELAGAPAKIATAASDEVRKNLDLLISNARASDLPADFKTEFLETLLTLSDRLHRVSTFGIEGVSRATAQVVGTLTIHEPEVRSQSALLKETAEVINQVADVFLKSYAITQLAGQTILQLASGS